MMPANKLLAPVRDAEKRRSFLVKFSHNVLVRLAALLLWKGGVLLFALVLGAAATGFVLRPWSPATAPPGVVLGKLTRIGEYHAARSTYDLNFTYVVHRGFWFFTGEKIKVVGSGSDDAAVSFAGLTKDRVIPVGHSATILLSPPRLSAPQINLSRTTLTESGGVLTDLTHLVNTHPQDASLAIQAAQKKISAAAARDHLIAAAEASTRSFLKGFLGRLGYSSVTVIFG
jgi:hypothetical protein